MPSPFPGMDPYLEAAEIFPDFHDRLIGELSSTLNRNLHPPYFSTIASRVFIERSDRFIGPDIRVLHAGGIEEPTENGGVGTAVISEVEVQPVVIHVPDDEIRELSLEIRTTDNQRLVTSIEVLSLANKVAGELGRGLYKRKQTEIIERKVHLVEIDFLRTGEHSTAVPLQRAQRQTGHFDYQVCVHRFDRHEDYTIYPIQLRSRLPKIGIPLLPDDADVIVNMQEIFERCYDSGLYGRSIHYLEKPPLPKLSAENEEWVRRLTVGR